MKFIASRTICSMAALSAAFLALGVAAAPARAAEDIGDATHTYKAPASSAVAARRVNLGIGKSLIIELPKDASEIFVSNPQIANAVVRSARKIYVIAAASGQTSVYAMDKDGNRIAVLDVYVGRDMDELRAILKTALPNNDIHVETVNDTVILTGSVDSAVEAQKAGDIAQAFVGYTAVGGNATGGAQGSTSINLGQSTVVNGKLINSLIIRSREQVMLKVTVAEVQRNVIKQLGISPGGTWGTNSFSLLNSPDGNTQMASNIAGANLIGGYGGAILDWAGRGRGLEAMIQAFEHNGVARVLAEPTVTAISGESAKFTAGGTVPVTSQSSIDPTTHVCTVSNVLTPYGVTLNFTPTVLSEGRISLHLATEVTEIDNTNSVKYACSNALGFRTRKNETTVELPSGGSIMSAGLIQQTSQQALSGMPALMNLPILGSLFRSRDYQRRETELVIMVTPYIAKTLKPEQVARPDDGFADASDSQGMFLGRVNRIYSTTANPVIVKNFKGRIGFIHD